MAQVKLRSACPRFQVVAAADEGAVAVVEVALLRWRRRVTT